MERIVVRWELCVLFIVAICGSLSAQEEAAVVRGGAMEAPRTVPVYMLPAIVPADTLEPIPGFRYGTQRTLSVPQLASWAQDRTEQGQLRYRIRVGSAGAAMLSFHFDVFAPGDGELYIQAPDEQRRMGPFTTADATAGGLSTPVFQGEEAELVFMTRELEGDARIALASITHGFRDLFAADRGLRDFDPGYQSAPCHTNVNCSVAEPWSDVKRSVAMFLRPDGGGCSGVMLNNTAGDGEPYFLTARHCYQANEGSWSFYFNYESPGCVGSAGPTDQYVTGASIAAESQQGDLLLLRLHRRPPAEFNVYYAGWDRSGRVPSSGAAIHHPYNDVKKINFFHEAPGTVSTWMEWWRVRWSSGITQGGSSGSPLFDERQRVVGFAFSGDQSCTNPDADRSQYVKLGYVWNGASATARVRDWLDPNNNTQALDGAYASTLRNAAVGCAVSVRVMLEGAFDPGVGSMHGRLAERGLLPAVEPYTALGYVHAGGGGGERAASGVLGRTTATGITDWVVVELRSALQPDHVLASRGALLRKDGMVVDMDGVSPVEFPQLAWGNYHIAIRHRNHLGVMTSRAQLLGRSTAVLNFMNGSVSFFGGNEATRAVGGIRCMIGGDADGNGVVSYSGGDNDRDRLLERVGGMVPTSVTVGYYREDLNLDGQVIYSGANNDRDRILEAVGGSLPTSVRHNSLP